MNQKEDSKPVHLFLKKIMLDRIDDYKFRNRINTRADAIRKLIEFGLKKDKGGSK